MNRLSVADHMQDRRQIAILAVIGVALGIFSFVSAGALFDTLMTVAAAYMLLKIKIPEDRDFLFKIFICSIVLRTVLLITLHLTLTSQGRWGYYLQDRAIFLFGDDAYYTLRSWWMAQSFSGHKIPDEMLNNAYTSYFYLPAVFYYFFGFSPISGIFPNCILSVMTAVVYYYMAKEVASAKVAKMTAVVVAFFPSLIIWSIINLKDSLFIFLTGLALLMFAYALKRKSIGFLAASILALIVQFSVRPKLIVVNAAIIAIFLIYYLLKGRKIRALHIVSAVLLIFAASVVMKPYVGKAKNVIVGYHRGVTTVGGINYRLYDDWVYSRDANLDKVGHVEVIKSIPKSWFHFFLEPFPWSARSASGLLVAPQMLVWYLFLFFAVPGVIVQMKSAPVFSSILILYFIIMGTSMSMTGGNIGTDFRLRDVLTPIVILFASAGISRFFAIELKGRER